MDRRQVSQVGTEVLALPKQVNEILRHGMAEQQKRLERGLLADVEFIQEHPAGATQSGPFRGQGPSRGWAMMGEEDFL